MTLALALLPLQLTFAALGEAGGGYDSTAVDPRSGAYVSAPLAFAAVDAQATQDGETVHQMLRDRFEAQYEATGGRDPLDSDVFNVTRYALTWAPREELELHTDAAYAIGAPTLFYSRAGRPDVSFAVRGRAYPRQMIADWNVRQDLVWRFSEVDALQAEVDVAGRYPVTPQPRGQNMFTPYASLRWTRDFDEDNNGHLGARVEYYALELFHPVYATQLFAGWGHDFGDHLGLLLEAGGEIVQSDADPSQWDVQPFGRAHLQKQFERQHLLIGASYAHTFGVVSPTLGTGALDIVNVAAYWRPGDARFTYFIDLSAQRGDGYDPMSVRAVTATYATAGVGARWSVNRWFRLFARYDFQWETQDDNAQTATPDFVRHVAIAGVQFAWGSNADALAAMMPLEELGALEHGLGIGSDASEAPVRNADPSVDEFARRRRDRLPGDPPDDEMDREARERSSDSTAGGSGAALPGDSDIQDPADPFAATGGGGDSDPRDRHEGQR